MTGSYYLKVLIPIWVCWVVERQEDGFRGEPVKHRKAHLKAHTISPGSRRNAAPLAPLVPIAFPVME